MLCEDGMKNLAQLHPKEKTQVKTFPDFRKAAM